MHCGGGVAVRKHLVNRLCQAVAADLISVAGHSLGLHQTPIEGQCSRISARRTVASAGHARETLLYPHAGLLNSAGCVRRHS